MPQLEVTARVPAKLMLAGEYTVLAGGHALAATVDLWLTAHIRTSTTPGLRIGSNIWPEARLIAAESDAKALRGTPLMHAAVVAAQTYGLAPYATEHGLEVHIDSSIDVSHGIGSSSALRLAVAMGMRAMAEQLGHSVEHIPDYGDAQWGAARLAWTLQRDSQGGASGYDIITQMCGGLVVLQGTDDPKTWPGQPKSYDASQLRYLDRLVRIYVGGQGAPTGALLRTNRAYLSAQEGLWQELMSASQALVTAFDVALSYPEDQHSYFELMSRCQKHRLLFEGSPGFPRGIDQALMHVPGLDHDFTWKPTGAGGDDAIILIGRPERLVEADQALRHIGRVPLISHFSAKGASASVTTNTRGGQRSMPASSSDAATSPGA